MSEGGRGRQKGAQTHRHRHTATPPSSLSFFRLRLSGSQRMSCGHCFKIGLTTMVASLSFPTPCLWTGCRTNCPKRTSTPCSATKVVVLCCAVLCCAVLCCAMLCVYLCVCVPVWCLHFSSTCLIQSLAAMCAATSTHAAAPLIRCLRRDAVCGCDG